MKEFWIIIRIDKHGELIKAPNSYAKHYSKKDAIATAHSIARDDSFRDKSVTRIIMKSEGLIRPRTSDSFIPDLTNFN